jgi:DNA-binding response OmpR family regulator
MAKKILVVDDDTLLRRSLSLQLEQAGYQAITAEDAETAIVIAERIRPDLILLDVGLPGMDGLDALKHFRNKLDIPVIFVTARRREIDTILGLELGADDYITKPFNPDILLSRIKAVLRRSEHKPTVQRENQQVIIGDLVIDPGAHTVFLSGKSIDLPAREFSVLHVLAINEGKVVSTDDLIAQVWGAEYAGEPQVVYVHMRWLREKIEKDPNNPQRIINVRGVGYKLIIPKSGQ